MLCVHECVYGQMTICMHVFDVYAKSLLPPPPPPPSWSAVSLPTHRGRDPRILQNFDIASLRERILQHTPPSIEVELVEGRHRRSQSVDALNSYKIRNNFENLPQRRRV